MLFIKWCSVLRRELSPEALGKKADSIGTFCSVLVAGLGENTGKNMRAG